MRRAASLALVVALVGVSGCDGIGQRSDLYAKLAPADQAKIDSIGPAVTAAVASALAGNLPGAVAEGVKAGANAIAVANSKDPDSDSALGLKGVIDALMGGALGFFATLAHRGKPKKA